MSNHSVVLGTVAICCLAALGYKISIRSIQAIRQHFYAGIAKAVYRELMPNQIVLDIGSGTGYFGSSLSALGGVVVCLDICNRHLGGAPFVCADARALPFKDGTFDLVTLFYMLHHSEKPEELLREAARVSRCGLLVHEDMYRNWFEFLALFLHIRTFHWVTRQPGISLKTHSEWMLTFDLAGLRLLRERIVIRLAYPITRREYWLVSAVNGNTDEN